ncbi:sulfatase-like hydrolase/transferase [Fulvimarina sp. MAC8]|uniref:sulfatase-like hydrolase/transferase n=1 Tax=Fulvimarina sp. MAC8 TaxID=3162874 RepID=UPI0032EE478B
MKTRAVGTSNAPQKSGRRGNCALRFAAGCLLLAAILLLPDRPSQLPIPAEIAFPIELLVAMGVLLLARGWLFRLLLTVIAAASGALLFLKLADLGTYTAFGRPFNPLLDMIILRDGWNLLTGTVGLAEALAVIIASLAAWAAIILLLAYCLAGAARLVSQRARIIGAIAIALAAAGSLLAMTTGESGSGAKLFAANNARFATERIALIRKSSKDLLAFQDALEADPLDDIVSESLFAALEGRDVYVLFVESYGRTVLSDPDYRALIAPRLQSVEGALASAGYSARSGWLTSPTVGGQSWLAHGAFLSGLPTTDQNRYDLMIASERKSLNTLFRENGWRTVAVMPAITMDWPEGGYYGYDAIYAADDLGYEGLPFNWVTMPDQFTLTAARRIAETSDRPVMSEIALISSHAPWTPIADLVPWEDVGDGRIFDKQATSGEPPSVVWSEPESIRDHFIRSIDYSLETIGSFIEEFGDDAVFIVLGDHQPARLLTGDDAPRDVPFHVISNDTEILARFDDLGLIESMIPDESTASIPMWNMRELMVRAMREKSGTDGSAGHTIAEQSG